MKNYEKQPWTNHERTLLADNYHTSSLQDLLPMFPHRTIGAIRNQVHYLKKRGYRFKRV
tara:strand:+ start:320 stop:496 length:177 start_codon:yes stop_codon:yes gene_type:complete